MAYNISNVSQYKNYKQKSTDKDKNDWIQTKKRFFLINSIIGMNLHRSRIDVSLYKIHNFSECEFTLVFLSSL